CTNRSLLAAAAAGVPVTTEIRLLVERLDRARVIGITGSAGKSTTAAMTHHVFVARGVDARLGGNLGGSLLGDLATIADDTVIVLELSSAMLYWLDAGVGRPDAPAWTPRVGVVTNITPNHVDWHGTFEHYAASKRRLLLDPRPGDVRSDRADREPLETTLAVPGRHNWQNAAVAIAAVRAMRPEITAAQATEALATYTSLPHRLRRVHEADGRVFYDDSKSTTPEACRLAVEAFDRARSVHLIAGGYDKGVDLSPIGAMGPSLGGLYVIGSTADAIALAAGGTAERCGTLEVAVRAAVARMASGDVLLLSPGCASWDQFENYEQRGRRFAELVRAATTPARREAT
ncbi:MAG: hypothetical protein KDA25_00125, partial [Phycisphaerales bacterium]|nr:hypothetical protein [Phycisphaerales bacterium]